MVRKRLRRSRSTAVQTDQRRKDLAVNWQYHKANSRKRPRNTNRLILHGLLPERTATAERQTSGCDGIQIENVSDRNIIAQWHQQEKKGTWKESIIGSIRHSVI